MVPEIEFSCSILLVFCFQIRIILHIFVTGWGVHRVILDSALAPVIQPCAQTPRRWTATGHIAIGVQDPCCIKNEIQGLIHAGSVLYLKLKGYLIGFTPLIGRYCLWSCFFWGTGRLRFRTFGEKGRKAFPEAFILASQLRIRILAKLEWIASWVRGPAFALDHSWLLAFLVFSSPTLEIETNVPQFLFLSSVTTLVPPTMLITSVYPSSFSSPLPLP